MAARLERRDVAGDAPDSTPPKVEAAQREFSVAASRPESGTEPAPAAARSALNSPIDMMPEAIARDPAEADYAWTLTGALAGLAGLLLGWATMLLRRRRAAASDADSGTHTLAAMSEAVVKEAPQETHWQPMASDEDDEASNVAEVDRNIGDPLAGGDPSVFAFDDAPVASAVSTEQRRRTSEPA